MDKDAQLLNVIRAFINKDGLEDCCVVREYDVCDDIPSDLRARHSTVVMGSSLVPGVV